MIGSRDHQRDVVIETDVGPRVEPRRRLFVLGDVHIRSDEAARSQARIGGIADLVSRRMFELFQRVLVAEGQVQIEESSPSNASTTSVISPGSAR